MWPDCAVNHGNIIVNTGSDKSDGKLVNVISQKPTTCYDRKMLMYLTKVAVFDAMMSKKGEKIETRVETLTSL